jgi:hypothetical protein
MKATVQERYGAADVLELRDIESDTLYDRPFVRADPFAR